MKKRLLTSFPDSKGPSVMGIMPGGGFERYSVIQRGVAEEYRQRFYDTVIYPQAGINQLQFFTLPQGQGFTSAAGAVAASPKTLLDTNLDIANTLPSGKQFVVETIELEFDPGSSAAANTFVIAPPAYAGVAAVALVQQINDVNAFYQAGVFNLKILAKDYLTEIAQAFPPKAGLNIHGSISATAAAAAVAIGGLTAKWEGRPYYVEPKLLLEPAVNIAVTLTYPGLVAMPSGFNGRVRCILDGYWKRAAQ